MLVTSFFDAFQPLHLHETLPSPILHAYRSTLRLLKALSRSNPRISSDGNSAEQMLQLPNCFPCVLWATSNRLGMQVSRGRYRHLFSGHGAFADGGPKHPHVGSSNSGGDDYSASTYATSSPPFSSTPMGASPLMSGSLYERRGDAQPPAGGSAGYSPPSQDGYRQHYSPSFSGPDPYGARSGGGRGFAAGGAWMMDPYGYPMPSPPSDMGMYPRAPAPGMMPPHHRGSGGGGGPMPQRQGHGLGAPTAHGGSGPRILSRFKTKVCEGSCRCKPVFFV